MKPMKRIYLSPPAMGGGEFEFVREAFETNWVAPLGPNVDGFEREFADYLGVSHAAAVASGTAALHLAVKLLGVQPGDEVLCSTLTFVASANPIVYEGARPVFIDADADGWNMDPQLLAEEIGVCARRGKLPKAVVVVDLYGQPAAYDRILEITSSFGIPVIQDSAEALGACYNGEKVGVQGRFGVFSFNGNKIITTSGGGMLVGEDAAAIERARFLATQARDSAPHYQHSTIGYNYRMSNVLAGIGRGQLKMLDCYVARRKRVRELYKDGIGSLPGINFLPIPAYSQPNYWLTCITIDPAEFGATREDVRLALDAEGIESRPVWKPLHMQPIFSGCRARGGGVAEAIFRSGLCLPTGSTLEDADVCRICEIITSVGGAGKVQ